MMFTTWIPPIEAELRLDAAFYTPKYVAASRRIHAYRRTTTFEKIRNARTPISYGVLKPQPISKGVYMIRNTDFDAPGIAPGKVVQISESQSNEFRRSIVKSGDLLVTIGGYVGTSAVVTPNLDGGNINQHIARVSLDRDIGDPYFYWAFVASTTGTMVLERWVSGTAQPGINLGDLKSLPIPWPDIELQQAIGKKVRKAERLRELAEAALTEAFNSLDQAMGFVPMKSHGRSAWAQSRDFGVSRFDAEYYQPHYLHMDRHLEAWRASRKPISTLRSLMKSGSYGVLPSSEDYGQGDLRFLRAQDVGAFLIEDKEEVLVPRHYANPKAMSREGDLLLEVKGEIAGGAICPKAFEGCLVNGSLYRMTLKEDVDAFYVLALLLSPIGVLQKKRAAANSVISYLSIDFLYDLLIPRLSSEEESNIGQLLRSYTGKVYQARSAIQQAKADVETLISNTLDIDALHSESAAIESWLAANPSPSV